MSARRFRTQQDIDRYMTQGYGQGVGADYKPWLRVRDVPSRSRSRKVHGLSALEYRYLVAVEFSERVVDIREQCPLLPVASVQDIVRRRGIRYPLDAGTTVPFVMTLKYADKLTPDTRLSRTLEKLELEKTFGSQRDVEDVVAWLERGAMHPIQIATGCRAQR